MIPVSSEPSIMNHSLLAVSVFVAIVAFAAGYDYKDEIYNQMIKQDIDELQASFFFDDDQFVNVRRRKREDDAATTAASSEKCKKRRWRMCCGEEIIDALIEKEKDLKKECFKEVMALAKDDKTSAVTDPFSCEKITKVKKEWACVMQCVGQKKNIVDEDGNINEKELLEHYKNELGSEEWFYSLIEAAYPKCLEQAKGSAGFTKDKEDPLSCNPVSIKMHHCMWRELQLSCPDDKITDTKTCSKIREKIKKNEFLPFKHHHHDDD